MRIRKKTILEDLFCFCVLVAVPVLLLTPGVLEDAVPVNATSALGYTPWEEARPAGMAVDSDPTAIVEAQRYFPWYVFLTKVERPTDLLWNPLEYAGQPFLAVWRTRCLSPFSLPFYFADAPAALRICFFLKLLVAGCCAFYAARRIGMRPAIAMIPAAAFQLCGPLLVWSILPISDVLPWLPLLFIFAERLALGQYRAWPGGAFVIAMMLLGGAPEACAALLVLIIVYFTLRVFEEWRGFAGTGASFGFFGATLALAFGIASIQILPFTEFFHFAVEWAEPVARYTPTRFELAAWVLPFVNSNPKEMSAGATIASHSGLVLALLLPVWLSLRPFSEVRTRQRCEALLVPAIGLNVLAHFWMSWHDAVPFGASVNPEHLLAANAFVLGLAGALTADEWLRLGVDEIKSTVKRFLFFGTLSLAGAVTAVAWPGAQTGLVPGPWWSALLAVGFVLAAIVVLAINFVQPSLRALGYSLATLVAVDLAITFAPHMPSTPRDLLFPETPFIAQLHKTGGRVTGSAALADWPLAGNSVPQLYGSSGVVIRHQHDYKLRTEEDPLLLRRSGSQLLLLKQEDIQGKFASLREVLRIEQVLPTGAILFFDTEAKGRAWMAYEARNVERYSPAEVKSAGPILVEQGVPPPPLPADKSPGTVTIAPGETNTRVTVTLDGVSKGILVLADAFFPGWVATIDGKPARVLAVDVLYRGVEIPEGAKEVEFEYKPSYVRIGLIISAICAAALIISAIALIPTSIRHFKEDPIWSI
ncbi:MAG: YfhO family protein [Candidatus Hydrogenedentes bacterium]|nr:YfhO family protein [Candidatus Hydrogenedentota bacterium]